MQINTETFKHCVLVTVAGQVDSLTAPELEAALIGLIESGSRKLVINLKEVPFLSSAGLRALITAQIKTRRLGPDGAVVISEITPEVRESLELVGFHHLFDFFDSDLRAVGSF